MKRPESIELFEFITIAFFDKHKGRGSSVHLVIFQSRVLRNCDHLKNLLSFMGAQLCHLSKPHLTVLPTEETFDDPLVTAHGVSKRKVTL